MSKLSTWRSLGSGFWGWLLMASAVRAPVLMAAVAFTSLTALAFSDADRGGVLAGASVIGLLAGTPLAVVIQRRLDPRRLLGIQLLACALAWTGLGAAVALGGPFVLWVGLAGMAGLTMSGSAGLVRSTLADAVPTGGRAPASTIDALSQDALIFLAPVLVAVSVPAGAVGVPFSVVVVSGVAILLVALVGPSSSTAPPDPAEDPSASAHPRWMKRILWSLFSLALGMALGATEAGAVGLAVRLGFAVDTTAWLFLILAGGSAVGAWLDIAAQKRVGALTRLLVFLASMIAGCLALAHAAGLAAAVLSLVLIGVPTAPLLGLRSHVFDDDAARDRSTGLTISFAAQSVGFAVGTALLAVIAQSGALLVSATILVVIGAAISLSQRVALDRQGG